MTEGDGTAQLPMGRPRVINRAMRPPAYIAQQKPSGSLLLGVMESRRSQSCVVDVVDGGGANPRGGVAVAEPPASFGHFKFPAPSPHTLHPPLIFLIPILPPSHPSQQ